ncbi:MAG: hypothetical protein AAF431_11180 [Pseudomonadota bacterium]
MKTTSSAWAILVTLWLTACSHQQVYEQVQSSERQRCERLVAENARADCLAGLGTDYRVYRQARDELSTQKQTTDRVD